MKEREDFIRALRSGSQRERAIHGTTVDRLRECTLPNACTTTVQLRARQVCTLMPRVARNQISRDKSDGSARYTCPRTSNCVQRLSTRLKPPVHLNTHLHTLAHTDTHMHTHKRALSHAHIRTLDGCGRNEAVLVVVV